MNRNSFQFGFIPVLISVFIIAGCATVMKMISEPVPEEEKFLLTSDPQTNGLLIVSVDVFLDPSYDIFRDNLIGEGITGLLGTSKTTGFIRGLKVKDEEGREYSSRLFDTELGIFIDPHKIFVVFDGLPEGKYKLSAASAIFRLSNSERKEFFDCEYIFERAELDVVEQSNLDFSNSICPFRADMSFSFEDRADSSVGLIEVTNSQVTYLGLLTIIENHRKSDYRTERKKINDRWQVVLDHGHSIEHIFKSEPRPGAEKRAVSKLAGDNPGSAWKTILLAHDKPQSES